MILAVIVFFTAAGPVESHRSVEPFATVEACEAALAEMRPQIITHAVRLSLSLRAEVRVSAHYVHDGGSA